MIADFGHLSERCFGRCDRSTGLWVGRDTLDPKTLERLRNLGVERVG
jgi:hypothetical protein